MESLGPECSKLKQKYEACFYQWYSEKYLTGKSREDECAPLFKEYRECLEKYLKEKKIDVMLEDHFKKENAWISYGSVEVQIGNSIRTIPESYNSFFTNKSDLFPFKSFSTNLKLILHLNETEKVLLVEGRQEVTKFASRLRFLLKWGHFVWRLSDMRALKLKPIRVVKPVDNSDVGNLEMKVHWQLKISPHHKSSFFYIDGETVKLNLFTLLQVQYHRFISPQSIHPLPTDRILYTGISRYVFEGTSGLCREIHVERIEPRISGVEWKWQVAKGEISEGAVT